MWGPNADKPGTLARIYSTPPTARTAICRAPGRETIQARRLCEFVQLILQRLAYGRNAADAATNKCLACLTTARLRTIKKPTSCRELFLTFSEYLYLFSLVKSDKMVISKIFAALAAIAQVSQAHCKRSYNPTYFRN